MRSPIRRLMAVMAAAILCLSTVAIATAVSADVVDEVSYAQSGGVQVDDTDEGAARNEIVTPAPDPGAARDEIVVPETDVGKARNEVVVPEQTPAPPPAQADNGIDAGTWGLIALTGATVLVIGVASVLVVRRRHHGGHMPHPV